MSGILTGEEGTAGGGPSGGRGLAHSRVHRETRDARGPSMNRGGLWSMEQTQLLLVYLANLWRVQSHTPPSPTVPKGVLIPPLLPLPLQNEKEGEKNYYCSRLISPQSY